MNPTEKLVEALRKGNSAMYDVYGDRRDAVAMSRVMLVLSEHLPLIIADARKEGQREIIEEFADWWNKNGLGSDPYIYEDSIAAFIKENEE